MARLKCLWCVRNFLQLVTIFYCILQTSSGSSGGYVEQYLDSAEVCSAGSGGGSRLGILSDVIGDLAKKKVRLANFPNNTVIIKLTRWQEMWSAFFNFRCQFTVTAPKKQGVMMAIQSMHLRTRGGPSKSCRDFIKFKHDNEVWTAPVCGELDSKDKSNKPEGLIGPRFISSSKGEIDVMFFTSNEDRYPEDEDPDAGSKALSLEIVFTAFHDCSNPSIAKQVSDDKMKQCSALRKMSCIPKVLYCDGRTNCGFDEEFGSDEADCPADTERRNSELRKSISIYVFAITAVSTLVIVIIFVLLVCCCVRRFQKVPRAANGSQRSHLDMEFHLNSTGPPSAPPMTLERGAHSPSNVKSEDLPPPYDALFPSSDMTVSQPVSQLKKK